ncbi:hypothetical protein [uncultured Pseudoxanthomonas sp.]|uniref:hypothetical protein n=1 Tax=uncultured Pseudoxanthomonas sp. TaxID=281701 RepID=UPI00262E7081|nr:hypothetical protein [uncultured Pseudoxanthomonas sp.]
MATAPEKLISDESEVLLRQVHPQWFQEKRLYSAAFRPTPKDQGELSVHSKALIEPEPCFDEYVEKYGKDKSAGVWGLSVADLNAQFIKAYRDPIDGDEPHCVADFNPHTKSQWEKLSKKLRAAADARGPLHLPAE